VGAKAKSIRPPARAIAPFAPLRPLIRLPPPSGNIYSGKSIAEMRGVHMDIIVPACIAIRICSIDFAFYDGLRSHEEQVRNVIAGVSRKEVSEHEAGNAGDLVPWVNGCFVWEKSPCIEVARAMREAVIFLGPPLSLIWGGVWDRRLEQLSEDLDREVSLYRERYNKKKPGKLPLFDGVHFERVAL
jgi:peptidoglycan LD-endopeptidase CwlK